MNTMKKIRWGILSTANIGVQKVIPAIQQSANGEVVALASRNEEKARLLAEQLGIPRTHASYEALLEDPFIDAIYNPLPNHLHVPWTIKALEAGKHVLCEKPIGLNASDARKLMAAAEQFPRLKLMEAFMYRFHPQWQQVKKWIDEGALGKVKTLQAFFSYFNADPANIRNQADIGGGALMDIGCYCIQFPRFIFGKEPQRVVALINHDPIMQTDRLTSGMLDFGEGISATFTCSTQLQSFQRVQIVGTDGRVELEIPVNAPPDVPVKVIMQTSKGQEQLTFGPANQYTLQAEAFAKAILEDLPVPSPFTDAIDNMIVIDALFESSERNVWVKL
jgi:predicted dehydrogenase